VEIVNYENKWERKDFYLAMRLGQRVTRWDSVLVLSSVAIGLVLWRQIGSVIILPTIVVAVVIGDLLLHFVVQPVRLWKLGVDSGQTKQITFSDLGLTVTSRSSTADIPWSTFARIREKADFYFLHYKKAPITTAIRKSRFKTERDEAQSRSIVRRNSRARLISNRGLDGLP
jgi:hypothetical protein